MRDDLNDDDTNSSNESESFGFKYINTRFVKDNVGIEVSTRQFDSATFRVSISRNSQTPSAYVFLNSRNSRKAHISRQL